MRVQRDSLGAVASAATASRNFGSFAVPFTPASVLFRLSPISSNGIACSRAINAVAELAISP